MDKVKAYIHKPVEVKAIQFIVDSDKNPILEFLCLTDEHKIKGKQSLIWKNKNAMFELFESNFCILIINTKAENITAKNRDYIIKDRMGFYNVMREDLFLKYYYEK